VSDTLRAGVTVVIPVHPPRFFTTLDRALRSVWEQLYVPQAVVVEVDRAHAGAAATRNLGLEKVDTEFVAFLDSDDQLRPGHLAGLYDMAREAGADLVYPWFDVANGWDPFPDRFGQPFDPEILKTRNTIPVTVLARTELVRDVGGFQPKGPPENPCEDWGCWEAMLAAGARFVHLPERTWIWHWHRSAADGNTSGRGNAW
jgi:glycosyltransferase involved in cell wall biosynthesis